MPGQKKRNVSNDAMNGPRFNGINGMDNNQLVPSGIPARRSHSKTDKYKDVQQAQSRMSPLNMNANPSGGAVSEMQRRVIDGRNSRERGPNS